MDIDIAEGMLLERWDPNETALRPRSDAERVRRRGTRSGATTEVFHEQTKLSEPLRNRGMVTQGFQSSPWFAAMEETPRPTYASHERVQLPEPAPVEESLT
ncbi:MAG: hypothetical protein ABEI99_06755, partial [Halobaculum sp.]